MRVLVSRIFLLVVAATGTCSAFKYRPSALATIDGAMWETAGRTYEPKVANSKNKDAAIEEDDVVHQILSMPTAVASPRGGDGGPTIDCARSTVLTAHSVTSFAFSLLFLLGSFGVDLPFGPAAILKDFDIGANIGDVLLCRLCSAFLFGIGLYERAFADDERAQKAFTLQHVVLSAGILLSRGSFSSDTMYYLIGALIVGFTAAGVLAK